MGKYCPLCDKAIEGSFCKNCKTFVKPYEAERNFHINESHDTNGNDKNCDYHQTSSRPYYTDPAGVQAEDYMNPKPHRTNEEFEKALAGGSLEPKTYGLKKSGSGNVGKKANGNRVLIAVWGGIIIAGIIAGIIVGVTENRPDSPSPANYGNNESKLDYTDVETQTQEDVFSSEQGDTQTSGIRDMLGVETLADSEYESMLAEEGFDEYGYKDADYDEIMEKGEPCNGWIHFEESGSKVAKTISRMLNEEGVPVSDYRLSDEYMMDNYYYMDRYGEIYSHYKTYQYYTIDDDSSDVGYNGYIYFVSDTVTGELMCVGINTDDVETFRAVSECVLGELGSKIAVASKFADDFEKGINNGKGEAYFAYGDLYYDILYYDEVSEDYYQYQAYIYLGN